MVRLGSLFKGNRKSASIIREKAVHVLPNKEGKDDDLTMLLDQMPIFTKVFLSDFSRKDLSNYNPCSDGKLYLEKRSFAANPYIENSDTLEGIGINVDYSDKRTLSNEWHGIYLPVNEGVKAVGSSDNLRIGLDYFSDRIGIAFCPDGGVNLDALRNYFMRPEIVSGFISELSDRGVVDIDRVKLDLKE